MCWTRSCHFPISEVCWFKQLSAQIMYFRLSSLFDVMVSFTFTWTTCTWQRHWANTTVNVVLLHQATLIKIINTHSQQIISCNPFKEIPWKDMYLFKVIAKKNPNLQRNYICTCTYFLKIVSFKNENSKDFFIQCEKI